MNKEPDYRPGRVKAVIFDLDGTLLDTLADIGNAVNRILALPWVKEDAVACRISSGTLSSLERKESISDWTLLFSMLQINRKVVLKVHTLSREKNFCLVL